MFGYKRKKIAWLNKEIDSLEDELDKVDEELKMYKGLIEIRNQISDSHQKTIQEYKDLIKELKSQNAELSESLNQAQQDQAAKIDAFKNLLEIEINSSRSVVDTNKALTSIIVTQQSSISALAEGIYNQEHIEFFALKTYRGWKYICCDGEKFTDFTDVGEVNINWKLGERVHLNISKIETVDNTEGTDTTEK